MTADMRKLEENLISDEEAVHKEAASPSLKRKGGVRGRLRYAGRIMAATFALLLIMTVTCFCIRRNEASYPYAIMSGDNVICYVNDRDTAHDAISRAIAELTDDDSAVKLIATGDTLRVMRADSRDIAKEDILDAERAAEAVIGAAADGGDAEPDIRVASITTEIRHFTPKPKYVKNKTAFAGTTNIREKGKDGTRVATVAVVTSNGKVISTRDIAVETTDEGKRAVIEKGILGLPEGADWKTYDGEAVYSDGEDLIVTAQSYVGVAKYVLGGNNIETGVDCVGFVREMYRLYGIKLSSNLKHEGFAVSYENAQPGDILCFSHHFGIYIGDGRMVHAANPKHDICVSKISAGGKLVGVRRIVKNSN